MFAITLMRHRAVRRVVVPGAVVALAAVAAASVVQGHPNSDDFSELAARVTPAVVNIAAEREAGPMSAGQGPGAPFPEGTPFAELGPAFDAEGRVIGVNTAIFSPTGGSVGIGFAIPSDTARSVIAELKKNGRVERGWLGVSIQRMTPGLAEGLGLDKPRGVLIAAIAPGGPAAKGGLRPGDVVTRWNGDEIDRPNRLARRVADTPAGATARVAVWRDGKTLELSIETGSAPDSLASADGTAMPPHGAPAAAGLALADIDPAARAHFGIADGVSGALIVAVAPGSAAAEQRLRAGDVIRRVGTTAVASAREAEAAFESLRKDRRAIAALLITSAEGDRFVALDLRSA